MPEISRCRKCANCCHYCIFLDFNEITQLFSCLIYKNKFRTIVRLVDYRDRIGNDIIPLSYLTHTFKGIEIPNDMILENLFYMIYDEGLKNPEMVCDKWTCGSLIHTRKSKIDEELVKITKRIMKQREEVIPDFKGLVEILNG